MLTTASAEIQPGETLQLLSDLPNDNSCPLGEKNRVEEGGKARKTEKCYSMSSLEVRRRIVPGSEPFLHFSLLGAQAAVLCFTFSLPCFVLARWQGELHKQE